ncbi:MAG: carbonic anhydrase family protein [Gammaproteobacteria bacterium]|nr:carbonic anhydrase family protein [Gammaproteobacteria bacterium]
MKLRHSALALVATATFALTINAPVLAEASSHNHHEIHWGYEGVGAPSHWGDLKEDYHLCKDGQQQSPIDIGATVDASLPAISVAYKPGPLTVVNNGHTIQVNYSNGSQIEVDGKKYSLLQFHFHAPSEHTFNGKPADMVIHFVHKDEDGKLGVIDVSLQKGKANPTIQAIWDNMPATEGKKEVATEINAANLIPSGLSYFNYSGSLTTPPCSEGVNWMVLKQPIELSEAQIAAFTKIFPMNARPVQPLHGRHVKTH